MDEITNSLLRKYISILREMFGKQLLSVAVFGSVARGKPKFPESDIDIFIVLEGVGDLTIGKRIDMLMDADRTLKTCSEYAEFKSKYGAPQIQEYIFTPEELKHHPPIMLDLTTDIIILQDTGILENEIAILKRRLNELGSKKIKLSDGRWYWVLKPDLKWGEVVEI